MREHIFIQLLIVGFFTIFIFGLLPFLVFGRSRKKAERIFFLEKFKESFNHNEWVTFTMILGNVHYNREAVCDLMTYFVKKGNISMQARKEYLFDEACRTRKVTDKVSHKLEFKIIDPVFDILETVNKIKKAGA